MEETCKRRAKMSGIRPRLTVKDERVAISEVDECREGLDAVTLGQLSVLYLDHVNPVYVTLIVDVLQFGQHRVARSAVGLVWRSNNT